MLMGIAAEPAGEPNTGYGGSFWPFCRRQTNSLKDAGNRRGEERMDSKRREKQGGDEVRVLPCFFSQ